MSPVAGFHLVPAPTQQHLHQTTAMLGPKGSSPLGKGGIRTWVELSIPGWQGKEYKFLQQELPARVEELPRGRALNAPLGRVGGTKA